MSAAGIPDLGAIKLPVKRREEGWQPVYFWSSGYLLDPPHLYSGQHSDGVKYMMIAWRSESLGGAVRVMPLSPAMGVTMGVMVYDPQFSTLNNGIEFTRLTDWKSCFNARSCSKIVLLPFANKEKMSR